MSTDFVLQLKSAEPAFLKRLSGLSMTQICSTSKEAATVWLNRCVEEVGHISWHFSKIDAKIDCFPSDEVITYSWF